MGKQLYSVALLGGAALVAWMLLRKKEAPPGRLTPFPPGETGVTYQCPFCSPPTYFETAEDLQRHLEVYHAESLTVPF